METILIKRYPNRRLYDTSQSSYITLEDLAGLVEQDKEIRVISSKSGEDLTKRVMLQVLLLDDHARKLECLPVEFLRTLITLKDETTLKLFEHYIGATLNSFAVAQQAMHQNMRLLKKMTPTATELFPFLKRFGIDGVPPGTRGED